MTALGEIRQKPEPVQVVLKAHMTKASLNDPQPDWEPYAADALDWWRNIAQHMLFLAPTATEEKIAVTMRERLRTQPVWKDLL